MALAEARAAWQRTANRCFVQEDAKRAPKLACCSSVPPSVKQADTGPTTADGGQDIPTNSSQPFNRNPSYSNLSPTSRWWLHLQPNYGHQKGLVEEDFTSPEGNSETHQLQESSDDLARNGDDSGLDDQTSNVVSPIDKQHRNFITCEEKDFSVKEGKFGAFYGRACQDHFKHDVTAGFQELSHKGSLSCEVSRSANDLYFDSELSWIGAEESTPWWRTADTEELALLVAQRSSDLIENCDLPWPQDTHFRKDLAISKCCFSHGNISTSSLDQKPRIGSQQLGTHISTPSSLTSGICCRKLRMSSVGDQLVSGPDKALRGSPAHGRTAEMHSSEDDASIGPLLKALHHSQARAREAEKVAKQACADKEHVLQLVLRQASQLFTYKQWLQLLQLENMYFRFKDCKSHSAPTIFPRWTPLRAQKTQKSWHNSSIRKKAKRSHPQNDVGKCAIVFAMGLGLIGAGLLLGWTIGWMLPTCR